MKKIFALLTLVSLGLTSCGYYTCPTYADTTTPVEKTQQVEVDMTTEGETVNG
ncbi:hypothetical protein [Mangrovivirga cuniculi]|nr:hypothetical protein [Mangrovivirga cuniculi]